MPWKRRRSTWPVWFVLCLLLAATIAAPWAWPRLRALRQMATDDPTTLASRSSRETLPEATPSSLQTPAVGPSTPGRLNDPNRLDDVPQLPPLAQPEVKRPAKSRRSIATLGDVAPQNLAVAEPSLVAAQTQMSATAESALAADDYVVIDEPLVEPSMTGPITTEPATTEVEEEVAIAEPPAETPLVAEANPTRSILLIAPADPAAPDNGDANAPSLAAAAPEQSILAETAPTEPTPAESPVAEAPLAAPTVSPEPAPPREPAPLVRVEDIRDRLAMLPRITATLSRLLPAPGELAPAPIPAGPVLRHPPTTLVAQLDELGATPQAAVWVSDVRRRIDDLTGQPADAFEAGGAVAELRTFALRGLNEALAVADPAVQSAWLRTSRALERRLTLWELLADPRHSDDYAGCEGLQQVTASELPLILHEINGLISGAPGGESWRTYLELDQLAELSTHWADEHPVVRSETARVVLTRMHESSLTLAQREFLAQRSLAALDRQLRGWATGPVSLEALAQIVERYETRSTNRDADAIAEMRLRMMWSDDARLQVLADELNRNYRNANLRVAVASELLNRMIPPQKPMRERIRDEIAGAEVNGQSKTDTKVALRLSPEPTAWRFRLEATGKIKSQTLSRTWPAKLHNSSELDYEVFKEIVVDHDGFHVQKAKAKADGDTKLVGIDSFFGPVPIIGSLVESAAREKHRESRAEALAEVKRKVTRQAQSRMDKEANAKIAEFEEKIKNGVLSPMARLAIFAEPVDMSTTADRAIVRMRMASASQLGAHTPRPTAPADSLASIQVHESAINNAIRGLDLDGKRMTIGELHALMAEKFVRRAEASPPADLPQKAIIEFAPSDAVRVVCRQDRVELVLNIVELKKGRDSIKNVGVHAFFRPVLDGLELKLVRDGSLQFEGRQLRTGPRMILHSVFGKLLRKDQEVPVLASRLDADPRLSGLMITQFVIDDGWIAASLGPAAAERTAWRTRAAAPRVQ